MTASYVYQLHGPYGFHGGKQLWTPEQAELSRDDLVSVIADELNRWPAQSLARVTKYDGDEIADATADIRELLDQREREREAIAAKSYVETGAGDFKRAFQSVD